MILIKEKGYFRHHHFKNEDIEIMKFEHTNETILRDCVSIKI